MAKQSKKQIPQDAIDMVMLLKKAMDHSKKPKKSK
jgi:hypothetical protein